MADSIRLAVLKQITTYLLTEVTIANGYTHDLNGSAPQVVRGRAWRSEDDPLPLVGILEGLNPDRDPVRASGESPEQLDQWVVLLQGWVADDKANPTDPAHQLMASVKWAIEKLRKRIRQREFVGQALEFVAGITIEPGVVRPPAELNEKAFFWMRVVIELVEPLDDPFFTP